VANRDLDGGLREGGPSRSPVWRTPKESCKGLGSVTSKTKHSTHRDEGPGELGDLNEACRLESRFLEPPHPRESGLGHLMRHGHRGHDDPAEREFLEEERVD